MSKSTQTTYICPNCRRPSNFTIWQSINVTLNPELKIQLLDGRLLTFACPICTFRQAMSYSILYHDQNGRFMIWWAPEAEHGERRNHFPELDRYAVNLSGYRLRLVPTVNRLLEKIFIFDNGLDDRALELLKRYIWSAYLEEKGVQNDCLYISGVDYEGEHPTIQVSALAPGRGEQTFSISGRGGYPRALEMLYDRFNVSVQEIASWRIIDYTYWEIAESGSG